MMKIIALLLCASPYVWAFLGTRRVSSPCSSTLGPISTLQDSWHQLHALSDGEEDLSEQDIKGLLERAKEEDEEWLKAVLGDTLQQLVDELGAPASAAEISSKRAVDTNYSNEPNENIISDETRLRIQEDISIENEDLPLGDVVALGYSVEEAKQLKSSVISLILEEQVERPADGIPKPWFKSLQQQPRQSQTRQGGDTDRRRNTGWRAGTGREDSYTKVARNQQGNQQGNQQRSPRHKTVKYDDSVGSGINSGTGTAFTWSNPSAAAAGNTGGSSSGTGSNTQRARRDDYDDYYTRPDDNNYNYNSGEDMDEIEEIAFWPNTESFKDMLLEESKLRMEVAGDWVSPLLREENKWRFKLYEGFLQFLNEGFGDTFDEVLDSFDTDDDDYDDDEDRNFNAIKASNYINRNSYGIFDEDAAEDAEREENRRQQLRERVVRNRFRQRVRREYDDDDDDDDDDEYARKDLQPRRNREGRSSRNGNNFRGSTVDRPPAATRPRNRLSREEEYDRFIDNIRERNEQFYQQQEALNGISRRPDRSSLGLDKNIDKDAWFAEDGADEFSRNNNSYDDDDDDDDDDSVPSYFRDYRIEQGRERGQQPIPRNRRRPSQAREERETSRRRNRENGSRRFDDGPIYSDPDDEDQSYYREEYDGSYQTPSRSIRSSGSVVEGIAGRTSSGMTDTNSGNNREPRLSRVNEQQQSLQQQPDEKEEGVAVEEESLEEAWRASEERRRIDNYPPTSSQY